jgi:hypothetical protein
MRSAVARVLTPAKLIPLAESTRCARGSPNGSVVSERTAEWHVAQILDKLGMTTRSQVAAYSAQKAMVGDLAADVQAEAEPAVLSAVVGLIEPLPSPSRSRLGPQAP